MTPTQKRELIKLAVSIGLLVGGLLIPQSAASAALLLAAYVVAGYDVLLNAFNGIVHGQIFDENFLMAIATIGATIIGEYHEAVAVMILYKIGEWFQSYAVGRSRASIAALMDICPETATVERNGETHVVSPEEVCVDEIVVVKAGDRIPLDGLVVEGSSSLDTAALTGESVPRDVAQGDRVVSGCINLSGLLRIRVEKVYEDSTVARILEMVENASDKKAKVEGFITRFARWYTPAVCVAALLLFVIPPLTMGGDWRSWGLRALSFLVVSCPCALVISVPLSFFAGIGCAGKNGVLVKGSSYLETLAKADTFVFDKTGTLTKGTFAVTEVHPQGLSHDELLQIAASVEQASDHPISRSVCAACHAPCDADALTDVQEIAGCGVTARLNGERVAVGNERLMVAVGVALPPQQHIGTVVHVAREGNYLGCIIVSDEPKHGVREALCALRREGVRQLVMLTGDERRTAERVAQTLGISEVRAQLLPQDKVTEIERLLHPGHSVVYVGDGINDAPVLTRADAGVAMGALGSDAAVEAADVVLMDDDPAKLSLAMRISRRTLAIARQNIVIALAVKAAVMVLVAIGMADMWLAVFADVGVCVLAVCNAMRAMQTPGEAI